MTEKPCGMTSRAFNQGSDARILGIEVRNNPYVNNSQYTQDANLHDAWRSGWLHVHRYWGTHFSRLFPGRKYILLRLPKVQEPEERNYETRHFC